MTLLLQIPAKFLLVQHRAPKQHVLSISRKLSWLGPKSLIIAFSIPCPDNNLLWVHKDPTVMHSKLDPLLNLFVKTFIVIVFVPERECKQALKESFENISNSKLELGIS
jgi:hypothetical protein